jgi:REP element-mobilizing transposase RayT
MSMPRIARVCAEGYPHHITQRGNNKEKAFFDNKDKQCYLVPLQRYKDKYKMKILAYCLMGNHAYIRAIPKEGRPPKEEGIIWEVSLCFHVFLNSREKERILHFLFHPICMP